MLDSIATRGLNFLLKNYGAFVILVENILSDILVLSF